MDSGGRAEQHVSDGGGSIVAPSPQIVELQSIRGIAAFLVLIGHCLAYYATPQWWTFVKRLLNGQAEVEIFFILSGFVLIRSLLSRPVDARTIGVFYIKRIFRIYPALFIGSTLAAIYVLGPHLRIAVPGISNWMMERFRRDRFSVLVFIASYAGFLGFLIPPVWTIFVEIVASVFLPFVAMLIQRFRPLFWAALALLAAISLASSGQIYYHVDIYLVDFALGAALLLIDPDLIGVMRLSHTARATLALVFLLLGMCTRAFTTADVWSPAMQMYEALFLAGVIFLFGRASVQSGLLRSGRLVWLGDISYSVYILHFPIMCTWAKLFAVLWPSAPLVTNGWPIGIALCIPTGLTTLVLAHWCYQRIERPGIALGAKVAGRFSGGGTAR